MKFFDVQTAFFIPLWRRVVATVLPGAWAIFEASLGQWVWAAIFGASTAYLVHQFFIDWTPPED